MKTQFIISTVFCVLITLLTSCKMDTLNPVPDTTTKIRIRTQSLQDILRYGASCTGDLDVLRSNSVYPFTEVTTTVFNNFKAGSLFHSNIYVGNKSFDIKPYLTENQFKIWYQIITHANITWYFATPPDFLDDIPNEEQYSDESGYIGISGMPQYLPDTVTWDDCITGGFDCTLPF